MKNSIYLKCCACFICLYVLQFLIFPMLIPTYYPSSNNALWIFVITAAVFSLIAILAITDQLFCLFLADLLYGCMICIFNSKGMYGIGRIGMNLDGLQTRVSFKVTLLTSLIIVIFFYIIQFIFIWIKGFWKKRKTDR